MNDLFYVAPCYQDDGECAIEELLAARDAGLESFHAVHALALIAVGPIVPFSCGEWYAGPSFRAR